MDTGEAENELATLDAEEDEQCVPLDSIIGEISKKQMSLQELMRSKPKLLKNSIGIEQACDVSVEDEMVDELEMPGSSVNCFGDGFMGILGNDKVLDKEEEISYLKMSLAYVTKQNNTLQSDVLSLKVQLNRANKEIESLKQTEKDLINSIKENNDVERKQHEMEELQIVNNVLQEKLEKAKEDNVNLRSDLVSAKNELNKLKMEIARSKGDGEKISQQNHGLEDEIKRLQQEVAFLNKEQDRVLNEMESARRRSEEQVAAIKQELAEKAHLISRMSNDLVSLERSATALGNDNNMLQVRAQQADILDRELAQAKWRLGSIETQYKDLFGENAQLRNQVFSLQQQQAISAYSVPPVSMPPPLPIPISSSYSGRETLLDNRSYLEEPLRSSSRHVASSEYHHRSSSAPEISRYRMELQEQQRSGEMKVRSEMQSGAQVRSLASVVKAHSPEPSRADRYQLGGGGYARPPGDSSNRMGSLLSRETGRLSEEEDFGHPKKINAQNQVNARTTPFATDATSAQLTSNYDMLDRQLTRLTTEKTSLQEEFERLHQRGLKTLKERTRIVQIEARQDELSKEISSLRKTLASKPA